MFDMDFKYTYSPFQFKIFHKHVVQCIIFRLSPPKLRKFPIEILNFERFSPLSGPLCVGPVYRRVTPYARNRTHFTSRKEQGEIPVKWSDSQTYGWMMSTPRGSP